MRLPLALLFAALANPALAHIGHLGELGGHGHWIALGGIAIAGAIALLGARKKPADDQVEDDEDEPEEEGEPA
jgi:hypothetical protein